MEDKLHVYWRLKAPAQGADLPKLKEARRLATKIVGGDPTNVPAVHPIRWPGSWHRKKAPRLCQIAELNSEREVDLEVAFAALKAVAGESSKANRGTNHFEELANQRGSGAGLLAHIANILAGKDLHDSIARLATYCVKSGMNGGAAVNVLRALMEHSAAQAEAPGRWLARYSDIPRAVSTAEVKYCKSTEIESKQPEPQSPDPGWPKLDTDKAYLGIVGEIVETIEPTTEADPVAILLQLLTCFGNAVGRTPFYRVEADKHYANLFCLLVGASSKGRKGTSRQRVLEIMAIADQEWECKRVEGGLSSGEGLIYAVRDERKGMQDGDEVVFDEGVEDKRLLVYEGEFASTLAVMRREGNTLSQIIRNSWDGVKLSTMTRKDPMRATDHLISIVAHITADELRRELDRISMANGFANRFLMVCVKRSKLLPQGGGLEASEVKRLGSLLKERIESARKCFRVEMTAECKTRWEKMYMELSTESPGLLGAIVARGEAQTLRLALTYALLCDQPRRGEHFEDPVKIGVEHLEAARAVWDYCDASSRYIFGDMIGDPVMDEILRALRAAGERGMSRTQISELFGRNKRSDQLGAALEGLRVRGKAHSKVVAGSQGGRPTEYWCVTAAR
jgi:hypothetical protein